MTLTQLKIAIFLIAMLVVNPWAQAQNNPKTTAKPGAQTLTAPGAPCLAPEAMKASQLFGRWAVRYNNPPPGLPATATLVLERHAEFADSLAGTVIRPAPVPQAKTQPAPQTSTQAALAGDLDSGLLLLDESSDNIRITASWNGEMVPGSCGRVFAGQWKDLSADIDNAVAPDIRFTLTRLP